MGIRNIKRAMMKNNIFAIDSYSKFIWWMHFGHTDFNPGEGVSCEECIDYIGGICSGDRVPEECMMEESKAEIDMWSL